MKDESVPSDLFLCFLGSQVENSISQPLKQIRCVVLVNIRDFVHDHRSCLTGGGSTALLGSALGSVSSPVPVPTWRPRATTEAAGRALLGGLSWPVPVAKWPMSSGVLEVFLVPGGPDVKAYRRAAVWRVRMERRVKPDNSDNKRAGCNQLLLPAVLISPKWGRSRENELKLFVADRLCL